MNLKSSRLSRPPKILSAKGDSVAVVATPAVPQGDDLRDIMPNEEPIIMVFVTQLFRIPFCFRST
jgi:hypothetical protein